MQGDGDMVWCPPRHNGTLPSSTAHRPVVRVRTAVAAAPRDHPGGPVVEDPGLDAPATRPARWHACRHLWAGQPVDRDAPSAAGFRSHHPATIPIASAALAASAAAHLRIASGYPEAALEAFLAGFLVAKHDRWPARQRRMRPTR